MEHYHHCLYCGTLWFCHDECPYAGPSACADCREVLRASPDMTRRVVPLSDPAVLGRLAEHEGERLRDRLRRRQR